jgi:uncharacterized protein
LASDDDKVQVTEFTPWAALAGGALIGLAAVVLLWLTGRIAGVSGILNGVLSAPPPAGGWWRVAFLGGIIAGAAAYFYFGSGPAPQSGNPVWATALAGFLVGVGTTMSGGCTSGHGVCGLGRLSLRSLVATLTFLLLGIVTVFVVRHVLV